MADDTTIIEGSVKFRDGKKWKSRWCVMRKLSPVADCVHLQLYRDVRARCGHGGGGGGCKAALSLQHFLACESGFTLDKHSNTLALICSDLVAVLAFETRERLMQWQVKVTAHLGSARSYLVLVGSGGGRSGRARLPAGPARLHVRAGRAALAAGAPPRLLGVWELPHLRRYGVVEGRFCFEGGSLCGKGEGLHVLVTERARDIARDFDLASRGCLSPHGPPLRSNMKDGAGSPKSHKGYRPETRLSDLDTIDDRSPPMDLRPREEPRGDGEEAPYWPTSDRQFGDLGHGDTLSVSEAGEGAAQAWGGGGGGLAALQRCASCMSKLGALSRSSTAALTPGAKHFSPAWTMDALHEPAGAEPASATAVGEPPPAASAPEDVCCCPAPEHVPGPERPLKPTRLELNLDRKPLPDQVCCCSRDFEESESRAGPYENYDVPKLASMEVDGEYYDTPKRLKECLNRELFKITRSSTPNALILKKPCGCLLKLGRRRREPTVVEATESARPAACPCRRVTDWAHGWIKLPYCKKTTVSSDDLAHNKENSRWNGRDALYATIDLSRKTRRKTHPIEPNEFVRANSGHVEIDDGPLANYENLNFALSLEYYENAKDLLRRAGVTQSELNAIGANLIPPELPAKGEGAARCRRCGHPPARVDGAADDYLMMEPKSLDGGRLETEQPSASSGYAPMSPLGGFAFDAAARGPGGRLPGEKYASNPALCNAGPPRLRTASERADRRKRSSSADSSRFLENVEEFEGGGSSSSMETLRSGGPGTADAAGTSGEGVRRGGGAAGAPGTRDSSSSNDSGVSSCSLRGRCSRSTDAAARSPAEAEMPLSIKSLKGVVDTHSTSSGASDMSDYVETLSICSSHSSTDTPITMRVAREATSSLRPRSGREYLQRVAAGGRPPPPSPRPPPP